MLSAICFNLDKSKILSSGNGLTSQLRALKTLGEKPFKTILEKGEKSGNQHFLFSEHSFPS